ncbi:hypothetical protein [Flavobacterium sp.]|uniref:hypothetical protein n=1 Tax=Flavobacterium sp. TaxID=239 RepID=UPI00286DDA6A|nr:hypothetical protein [Flavobacterium sp.]
MKTITYTLAFLLITITFSSCTADEMTENTKPQFTTAADIPIDPPIMPDKPK